MADLQGRIPSNRRLSFDNRLWVGLHIENWSDAFGSRTHTTLSW
uniref:Macaca fascicularis brain cDNA clone: QflA-20991, similar to human APG4 autophagy 4 homolog C (S. cerevisiae) (APG4C),transcript variant 1, mRNA, RefSeq: NM_032852.2 n=1 Tax=Macaca fascicularis TaxID=9541 RepID=I7GD11_MACFA|nr:unnamed protein product [Macaca fascicularis]